MGLANAFSHTLPSLDLSMRSATWAKWRVVDLKRENFTIHHSQKI